MRPFFRIACCGDPFPPITLLGVGFEPPVHLRHHGYVAVAELAGDQLERSAGASHPDRPVMPGVMQPIAFEPEHRKPLAVRFPYRPAIEPSKDTLAGEDAGEVVGDRSPAVMAPVPRR